MSLTATSGDLSKITVSISDQAIYQELDGEMVLLELQTGGYYGLNGVGSRIWTQLQEGRGLIEILEQLAVDYEVARERVAQDLRNFLANLDAQGLVSLSEEPA